MSHRARLGELKRLGLRGLRHSTVRNALMLYAVQISTFLFPLITLPYLSRVLSPEKFGLLAYGQSFAWYFYTLSEYGFDLTATRQVAINRDDPAAVSRIFGAVMGAKTLLTALGFLIMVCVVFATPKLRADWPLFFVSFLMVVGGWLFPMWLFQGVEKLGIVAARDFAAKAIATILIFVLIRKPSDYLLAAAIQSGGMIVAGVASLISAPLVTRVRFSIPSWPEVNQALKDGWPVFLSMAALNLTGTTSIFVLGLVAPPAQVGFYMGAFRLIVAGKMLVTPVVTALYPHISHMAANSSEATIRFLRRYAVMLASPFLVTSVLTIVFAPLIIRLLLGPKFGEAVLLLRIMAFSPFLLCLSHSFSTYYMLAFGFHKEWSRIIIGGTILNFVLMGPFLLTMKPAVAMAVLGLVLDVYSLSAAFLFYRRNTRLTLAPNSTGPPVEAVPVEELRASGTDLP
jgi:polysaccharide transporter, PST family